MKSTIIKAHSAAEIKPELKRSAFTLVELITVLAIMSVLMLIAMPSIVGTLQANRLTSAGEGLMYRLSRLQQEVATSNHAGEIRFYRFEMEGVRGFHAYQLFAHDAKSGELRALENPIYFKDSNLTVVEGALSPLLEPAAHGTAEGVWPKSAVDEPFKSLNAEYFRISFLPNGTTSLSAPLRQCYLTLASEEGGSGEQGARPPANYYTIQVDPVTGRARAYRP
jgi:uncharacterized protein (TIGR02596 family)